MVKRVKSKQELDQEASAKEFIRNREKAKSAGESKRQANETATNIENQNPVGTDTFDPLLVQRRKDLAATQLKEIQNNDTLKSSTKKLTPLERNVEAGQATVKAIRETFGASQGESIPIENMNAAQKGANVVLGKVVGTSIFGFSIAQIFSNANRGNIRNAESDAKDMVSESNRITRAATSKGADIKQAIKSAQILEEGIRAQYNNAQIALRASPQDISEGLDLMDEMSRDLRIAMENRHALERYALTGDVNELLLVAGTDETQNLNS